MKIVLKKKVGFFRYLDLNFSYFLLYCIIFGDVGGHWHPLIGTCLSKWLETAFINWHRIDLYLCRRGLKFIVSCNQEQRLSLMLIFVKFWWLRTKIQGGVCNSQGTHFVFESYLVGPSIWPSFIQIGEIACVTPACSHGHSLKVWATVIGNLGKRFNS